MKEKYTGYNSRLTEPAGHLRKEMTPQERRLWYGFLRNYPVKIYRQRPIDRFIADFYCSQAHLVIELDGVQHHTTEGAARDTFRTELLEKYGLEVIRFSNWEVNSYFTEVCSAIDRKIKERMGLGE